MSLLLPLSLSLWALDCLFLSPYGHSIPPAASAQIGGRVACPSGRNVACALPSLCPCLEHRCWHQRSMRGKHRCLSSSNGFAPSPRQLACSSSGTEKLEQGRSRARSGRGRRNLRWGRLRSSRVGT
ncbi:hypothetical protein GQ55_2G405100 [Panicum hallii var. hallii]|uniref:Secreted protein n=1 Tax=Panicum hallii var. hallii TaxID=1504633 RepID=A0A2T7EXM5_9POAL|nr:hypothetical protein GQ55_2G405100 [Panicum hallii var. hallii]